MKKLIEKITWLVFSFVLAFAVLLPTQTFATSLNSAMFFCQKASVDPVVVSPSQLASYRAQGYQCTPITHKETFECRKDIDVVIVFGGSQASLYKSLGYTCKHLQ